MSLASHKACVYLRVFIMAYRKRTESPSDKGIGAGDSAYLDAQGPGYSLW